MHSRDRDIESSTITVIKSYPLENKFPSARHDAVEVWNAAVE